MYKFHYEEILNKYGSRAKLAYTDTDSFIYHIQTPDLYKEMADNMDAYDTSDYPVNHTLHSRTNAKVLRKMKDECSSLTPQEFVGLRVKMYSILLATSWNISTTKITSTHWRKPSLLLRPSALFDIRSNK